MSFESDLRTYLLSKPAISALVGTRVYPLRAPQNAAYPQLTYGIISDIEVMSLEGSSGLTDARLHIDCWANDAAGYSTVKSLKAAVRNALTGFSGWMGSTEVGAVLPAGDVDLYEQPESASDTGVHHIAMDYEVSYQITKPTL